MKATAYRTAGWCAGIICLLLAAATAWVIPVAGLQSTPANTPAAQAVVGVAGLNVRAGPGTSYRVVTVVVDGDVLVVLGRDAACQWLRVRTPKKVEGWVSITFIELDRNCSTIPLTQAESVAPTAGGIVPASTATAPNGTGTVIAAPPPTGKSVTLISPLTAQFDGRQEFEWQANFALAPDQFFELVFWEPGQDPMLNSFSPVGASTATRVLVNLTKARASLSQLRLGADYQWGILLVTLHPYRRLQYLGGGHPFQLGRPPVATLVVADTPTPTEQPGDATPTAETETIDATLEAADTPTPTETLAGTPSPLDTVEPTALPQEEATAAPLAPPEDEATPTPAEEPDETPEEELEPTPPPAVA
jgi:uncharacterized protein YraI